MKQDLKNLISFENLLDSDESASDAIIRGESQSFKKQNIQAKELIEAISGLAEVVASILDGGGELNYNSLRTITALGNEALVEDRKHHNNKTAVLIIGFSRVIGMYLMPDALKKMSGEKRLERILKIRCTKIDELLNKMIQEVHNNSINAKKDEIVNVLRGLGGAIIEASRRINSSSLSSSDKHFANRQINLTKMMLFSGIGFRGVRKNLILKIEKSMRKTALSEHVNQTKLWLKNLCTQITASIDKVLNSKTSFNYWEFANPKIFTIGPSLARWSMLEGSAEIAYHLEKISSIVKNQTKNEQNKHKEMQLRWLAGVFERAAKLHLKLNADEYLSELDRIQVVRNAVISLKLKAENINFFLFLLHPELDNKIINAAEEKLRLLKNISPQLVRFVTVQHTFLKTDPGWHLFVERASHKRNRIISLISLIANQFNERKFIKVLENLKEINNELGNNKTLPMNKAEELCGKYGLTLRQLSAFFNIAAQKKGDIVYLGNSDQSEISELVVAKDKKENLHNDAIIVIVEKITLDTKTNKFVIVLKDKNNKRLLYIVTTKPQAQAIQFQLENLILPVPLPYDLGITILKSVNAKISSIVVNDLRENSFHSVINLEHGGISKKIAAGPSDAIALALRAQAPIYVSNEVMEKAAVSEK